MNWKKIAAVFMACGLMTGAASAQQPAAESYQNMLQQGKFQLEYTYEGESGLTRITTDKGMRLVDKQPDGKDWNLEAFAAGDKIYQFYYEDKKQCAKSLPLNLLGSSSLSPDERWDKKQQALSLPDELSVLSWQDKWTSHPGSLSAPAFTGSSQRNVDGADYDCDQYLCDIRNQAGGVSGQLAYNFLYHEGKLMKVQKYLLHQGQEQLLATLLVVKLDGTVPEDAFASLDNIPLYRADLGDINDLLDVPVQEGTLGGSINAH